MPAELYREILAFAVAVAFVAAAAAVKSRIRDLCTSAHAHADISKFRNLGPQLARKPKLTSVSDLGTGSYSCFELHSPLHVFLYPAPSTRTERAAHLTS